jgi:exonuclease SbcD
MKLILTADIHLKKAVPVCRPEDEAGWLEVQRNMLLKLSEYAMEKDAYLLFVGDIFDAPVASLSVVNMFLGIFLPFKDNVFILAGNHDLRGHNYENVDDSSYGTLRKSFGEIPDNVLRTIGGHHFNEPYQGDHKVVCTHQLVFPNEGEASLCGAKTASQLLKEYPSAKLVLTGDMHSKFVHEEDGRYVVNPGCATRQSIKYADYTPSCYFIDTLEGEITQLDLPDTEAVLSTSHRDKIVERDERIANLLEIADNKGKITMDFLANLQNQIGTVPHAVQEVLLDLIREVKEGEE